MLTSRDVEETERIEAELDGFIERRARQAEEECRVEEAWKESARKHNARRREANLAAWRDFHAHMQRLHAGLAQEHAAKAEALGDGGV